ncbi:MAG: hypothetical protein QM811_02450 [Pirellulales bacterium]
MFPWLRNPLLIAMLALPAWGCAARSGIDPTGQRIFEHPGTPVATPAVAGQPVATTVALQTPPDALALPGIALYPGRLVAPIGNEVILVAGAQTRSTERAVRARRMVVGSERRRHVFVGRRKRSAVLRSSWCESP